MGTKSITETDNNINRDYQIFCSRYGKTLSIFLNWNSRDDVFKIFKVVLTGCADILQMNNMVVLYSDDTLMLYSDVFGAVRHMVMILLSVRLDL